ncbi:MAG: ABC transporter substrate-binding protein [Pseudonocardia sp.]|nr:ABC transporter substrate-binding protein [Pseudonocardia sp.]
MARPERHITRRDLLRFTGTGIAVATGSWALAACGGGNAGVTADEAAGPRVNPTTLTDAEKQTLLKMAGPIDAAHSGQGMTWKLGAAFPFTGPYGYYQTIEGDGLRLAAQHIPQLGGPTIDFDFQNFGGANGIDTQKAVDAVLQIHDTAAGAMVSGIGGAMGAVIPGAGRYQILCLDGGAGVGQFANKPYYWAMRNQYPVDNVGVICEYVKKAMPNARSATLLYITGPSNDPITAAMSDKVKASGVELAGTSLKPLGTTDWSDTFTAIKSQNPDIVLAMINGNDAAYFMKQYVTTGLTQPVFGSSYSQPQAKIAGNGFENKYYFCQEDFLPDQPSNDWGAIFAKYYRQAFPDQPTAPSSPMNLSANYYNLTFVLWALARRVLAKGGDINKGDQLQEALTSDPTFPSIFGGSGSTPGSMQFAMDGVNGHGLEHSPLGIFQVRDGALVRIASSDSKGGQMTITSA